MNIILYFILLVFLFAAELAYFKIADHYNIIDKPNERSSHTRITLRGGGVIFYISILCFFVVSGFKYPWFFLGLTIASAVSFVDDIRSLSPKARLILQFTAMLLMLYQVGLFSKDLWWMIPIALILATGCMNIFNFMDGINGISGGYALIVLSALFFVNRFMVPFVDERLILFPIISALVFCFFNFRTKARCFAGDVGSVSMAFIILFLLGLLMYKTKDLSWFAFVLVYGVDGTLTVFHRILLHENITTPHRKHAYQLMANELKFPHVIVSSFYMALQAIVCLWYIFCPSAMTFWLAVIVYSTVYIIFKIWFYKYRPKVEN